MERIEKCTNRLAIERQSVVLVCDLKAMGHLHDETSALLYFPQCKMTGLSSTCAKISEIKGNIYVMPKLKKKYLRKCRIAPFSTEAC